MLAWVIPFVNIVALLLLHEFLKLEGNLEAMNSNFLFIFKGQRDEITSLR